MPRPAAALALLVTLGRVPLAAQNWAPDTTSTRLAWGTVNVLITADTVSGIRIWAHTVSQEYRKPARSFIANFDPARVDPWLARANLVLTYKGAPASDSVTGLQTPPLEALDSSHIVLTRRREKKGWDDQVSILLLDRREAHPWSIVARPKEAQEFLQALFGRVSQSRLQTELMQNALNPLAVDEPPQPLPDNPRPVYPSQMGDWGRSGEVWVLFIVRPDGTPDPASFKVLLYDHRAFVESAVFALKRSHYTPGRLAGEAVPTLVVQQVAFTVR